MFEPNATIAQRLQQSFERLTRAERQLADSILENYPVSGLGTITTVARNADVSTPTVARMVQKLGYSGFPEFQEALRRELRDKVSDPIAKRAGWAGAVPDEHILNRFTDAVIGNIRQSLGQIDIDGFDQSCALLADLDRSVHVVGGRITRALADYFFLHMQVARPDVHRVQTISNVWPHDLLDMKQDDVLVVFDVRRYENSTLKLAQMAAERGVRIVLFTDQWCSPVSAFAAQYFACRIVVPSAWDSSVVVMLLLETVIAEVQERIWPVTRERLQRLEGMFDSTRLFRKFT